MKKLSLILAVALSSAALNSFADQNIEIIGGTSAGNPKLAIVNFAGDDGTINDELSSDFKVTGEFNVINYASSAEIESEIQYILEGTEVITNDGATSISYKLSNNTTHKVLLDQTVRYSSKYQRKAVHNISNIVYQKLTNTKGIFTSKIALAIQKAAHSYAIIVADYDGYNQKTILSTAHPISSLAWDSTGNSLSYVTWETSKPVVYVQNLSKGTRYSAANFSGSNSSPAFTPDGRRLAVTLSRDYGSHIFLVDNRKYQGVTKIVPLISYGPTIDTEADISTNGKVLFTSDHDGGPQIFMSDLKGSAPVRITNGKALGNYNTTARFSNDASKISFISRNEGVLKAYVMDLTTKSAYPISMYANHDLAPSFAPNDKLILFSSDNNVFISNATGTVQTKLNNINALDVIDQRWAKNF